MKSSMKVALATIIVIIVVVAAAVVLSMNGTNKSISPALSIASPSSGASIAGPNITVTVFVQNFNIVDKLGQASVSGEGHIHYFLDVVPPTTPNVEAFTAAGTYAASVE